MSLRWKLTIALGALAGVIASLAAAGAYVTASGQLSNQIDRGLLDDARSVMGRPARIDHPGRPGEDDDGARRGARCPDPGRIRSVAAAQVIVGGRVVSCEEGVSTFEPTAEETALAAGVPPVPAGDGDPGLPHRFRDARIGDDPVRVITLAFPSGGALQLARDVDDAEQVLDGLRIRLVLIALAAILVAAVAGFALATRIVRPIRRLTSTAHHIAATRDLTTPVPPGPDDEIGSLAESFTSMVGSLAASRAQQQRLISDASHEMRTPLTSLRTNLELLTRAEQAGSGVLSDADRRALVDDLRFETGELTALLTELVELATDPTGVEEAVERTDLVELCRNVADRAERRSGREVDVVAMPGSDQPVAVRPHQIERAVANLVDNALKYSPAGTTVEVRVTGPEVSVRDHGPGIDPDDLPHVFLRFFRAASARTEPGSGLGLAIVAQIVESHGGRVFASNAADGGAVVGFVLPDV